MPETALAVVADHPSALAPLAEQARNYARQAKAANTRRAYRAAWEDFAAWCAERGTEALPATPALVGLYLTDRAATHKVASLRLRLVAIRQAHTLAGHRLDSTAPEIAEVLKGIIRTRGTAPAKKEAAVTEVVRDALRELAKDPGLRALRDRALLLLGFAAALRRSELVALERADIVFSRDGLMVTLRRAKTDQEGKGAELGIPFGTTALTCPVRTLQAWLDAAGIKAGPLFVGINKAGRRGTEPLSDKAVALVVKAAVTAAGYNAKVYSGHSLRSGFATSAARAGVPEAHIQIQTRHKSLPVLRGYIRRGSLFNDNAAAKVGL
ncbi:tyrosine-type recombinase/integrase [Paracraurococcus lichenis]|uniref:Tyrosine-type recombinase/integrase n=1 Tax=Paracraurococcus lichenis TaxID=3064888 RepID=A0ABT9ED80_9PROT|nr:tyrosine-type recombinase/integrase [Paracraurococcus sp. LOR1-02]MDO9714168.1 tyrosine-type recombinase/integrase [Paracraurococcus sp. LOR1-02]